VERFNEIKQELKLKIERTLGKYTYEFPGAEGVEWKRGALRCVIVLYKELERTSFSSKLSNLAVVPSSLPLLSSLHSRLFLLTERNGIYIQCVETTI
jgi:hypothetical protein